MRSDVGVFCDWAILLWWLIFLFFRGSGVFNSNSYKQTDINIASDADFFIKCSSMNLKMLPNTYNQNLYLCGPKYIGTMNVIQLFCNCQFCRQLFYILHTP